jgi:hypothetical protein
MYGNQMSDVDKFGMSRGLADLISFANFGIGHSVRFVSTRLENGHSLSFTRPVRSTSPTRDSNFMVSTLLLKLKRFD